MRARCVRNTPCSMVFTTVTIGAFSKAGVDYKDPSLKVLTGAPAKNGQACCNACAAYNAQNGEPACVIGVWHNLGTESKCDLKSSASQPVLTKNVTLNILHC